MFNADTAALVEFRKLRDRGAEDALEIRKRDLDD